VIADTLLDLKMSHDVVVIGYLASDDTQRQEQFQSLANAMHPEYVFGTSTDRELAIFEGISIPFRVMMHKLHSQVPPLKWLFNNTTLKLKSLWHVGYLHDNLYGF
jgi:hypothetical protein